MSDAVQPAISAETLSSDKSVGKFMANPHAYEFFQAIRILARRLEQNEASGGGRFDAGSEPARVAAHTSFSFPASDIHSVTVPGLCDCVWAPMLLWQKD